MNCSNCGQPFPDSAKLCPNCGAARPALQAKPNGPKWLNITIGVVAAIAWFVLLLYMRVGAQTHRGSILVELAALAAFGLLTYWGFTTPSPTRKKAMWISVGSLVIALMVVSIALILGLLFLCFNGITHYGH